MIPKIAVYSANIGGYEQFYDHMEQSVPYDHIVFTDRGVVDNTGRIKYRKVTKPDSVSNHVAYKKLKMLPEKFLPGYDITIWIDGNMRMASPFFIEEMVSMLGDGYFAAASHCMAYINQKRYDLYDEVEASIADGNYSEEPFDKLVEYAKNSGYLPHHGLWLSGLLVRTPGAARLNHVWHSLTEQFSTKRPQCQATLSLAHYLTGSDIVTLGDNGFVYTTYLMDIDCHNSPNPIRNTIDVHRK